MNFRDYLTQPRVTQIVQVDPQELEELDVLDPSDIPEIEEEIQEIQVEPKDNTELDVELALLEMLNSLTELKVGIENSSTLLIDDEEIGQVIFVGLNDLTLVLFKTELTEKIKNEIVNQFILLEKERTVLKETEDSFIIDVR